MNRRGAILFVGLCACVDMPGLPDEASTSTVTSKAVVCGDGPTVKGVDVSYYQGTIDWAAARADGVEFAFVRVSDGLATADTKFDANWAGTRANGILRGAYQFFRPAQDPIAQAELLLSRIGTLEPGDLPPVIDVEAASGLAPAQVAASVRAWIDHVTPVIGRAPIIYTGFYFWRDQVGAADMTSSPLWHAQYTSAQCPNIPPPWTDWAFWQFTSEGRVAGITGNVDVNRWNGTREQLDAFVAPARPCNTIPPDGGTIEESDACFVGGGPRQYLRRVATAGEGGSLIWTHTTDAAEEANFGRWNLVVEEAGTYLVEVATPAAFAQSKQARYVVRASGAEAEIVIDQSAVDGWQPLGEVELAAGGDQYIHLGDNTGEPLAGNVKLVFDAVRLTRVRGPGEDPGEDPGKDPGGDEPRDSGGCHTGAGSTGLATGLALLALRRRRAR
ncbi:MAG: hypothetical protein KF773_28165 [Deltaproteobacteria bacterium]|nr:hypothetical protein [Deltaproteobacteria bacterium]MCW5808226.1 hypothetical protein [Deltaproteobacteria bacterium]